MSEICRNHAQTGRNHSPAAYGPGNICPRPCIAQRHAPADSEGESGSASDNDADTTTDHSRLTPSSRRRPENTFASEQDYAKLDPVGEQHARMVNNILNADCTTMVVQRLTQCPTSPPQLAQWHGRPRPPTRPQDAYLNGVGGRPSSRVCRRAGAHGGLAGRARRRMGWWADKRAGGLADGRDFDFERPSSWCIGVDHQIRGNLD